MRGDNVDLEIYSFFIISDASLVIHLPYPSNRYKLGELIHIMTALLTEKWGFIPLLCRNGNARLSFAEQNFGGTSPVAGVK